MCVCMCVCVCVCVCVCMFVCVCACVWGVVLHVSLYTAGIIDTPVESLFTYQPGESWATYYNPYFVPIYLTQFSDPDLAAQANELCGTDPFCLFDIAATGRVDIGLSTLQGSQEFEQIVQLSLPGT